MSKPSSLSLVEKLIRPQVCGFEPYLPGRSIESVKREHGFRRLVKLASNENPLGPSPRALRALGRVGKTLFRYPDGASTSLRRALAQQAGLPVSHLIAGAGSDELIELLGKTFLGPRDSIVVSEHAFIRYRMAGELMGSTVISVPMRHFSHDLAAMARAIRPNTKMLFIANPNNPTGTYNTQHELHGLLKSVAAWIGRHKRSLIVVVDEAYYEYARALQKDYPHTVDLQRRYANLVILRTFSKAHALAGLRVGYGIAHPNITSALDRVRPPFNVSIVGQVAAEASLSDRAHIQRSVRLVQEERKKVVPILTGMGLPVVPSAGNFILIDVSPRRGSEVFEALLRRGVIVRSMDEYGFPHHIRVTYGLPAERQLFFRALREVMSV